MHKRRAVMAINNTVANHHLERRKKQVESRDMNVVLFGPNCAQINRILFISFLRTTTCSGSSAMRQHLLDAVRFQ